MLLLADASSYRQFSVLPIQSTAGAQRDGTDTASNFIILRTDQIGLAEWKAGAADSLSQDTQEKCKRQGKSCPDSCLWQDMSGHYEGPFCAKTGLLQILLVQIKRVS